MSYRFTPDDQIRLQEARGQCPDGDVPTTDGNWVPFFSFPRSRVVTHTNKFQMMRFKMKTLA
ncbi:MAG: hypothetical protein KUG82_21375 [Pseudomonadales bacterium]|nr:hypothetical protein [Pseudomonadales bacterium]